MGYSYVSGGVRQSVAYACARRFKADSCCIVLGGSVSRPNLSLTCAGRALPTNKDVTDTDVTFRLYRVPAGGDQLTFISFETRFYIAAEYSGIPLYSLRIPK